ncbi:MAG: glycosyltransferase family 39 protein [Candidatus Hinthialibacter antarcticus]|nr:glycosyltransferase family 39 protein [Candidatus Hinthialibacter antarcticus]
MIKPTKKTVLLVLILLAAFMARAWTINYGTNVDEGVYWTEARELYQGSVIYRDTQFNKTPLVAMVGAAFFPLGDAPIYPMRVAMLLFSVCALYAFFQLAKNLFGDAAAWASVILLAFEPFSCVWAKYLHTSSWAPWFEIGVIYLFWMGLKKQSSRWIFASGLVLGFYALSKQTAIYTVPPAIAAWLLFSPEISVKRFAKDGAIWAGGIITIMGPFFIIITALGALSQLWFDIFTAHTIMAGVKYHDFIFRWHEWKSVIVLSPLLWLAPLGSLPLLRSKQWRGITFAWIWLITVFSGNLVLTSHVWRHYFLVAMPPAALLSGYFLSWIWGRVKTYQPKLTPFAWGAVLILITASIIGWPKNDWAYPGLTLEQESLLARHVQRYCPEPYLLNLTNPALYVWSGKQIPAAYQGDRMVKIPFFMTIAGRGYLDQDDMKRTVEYWKTQPIGAIAVFDKFLRQIQDDPVMEPLRDWMGEEFQPPQRVAVGQSYYGWFFVFETKRNVD